MGMTDGHILFDVDIYNKGQRPAINIPLSVTRVGRQTQTDLYRSINVEIETTLSQYTKIQNIAHLGSELSTESKRALEIGQALSIMLQQEKNTIPRDIQVALFGIAWNGMSDLTTNELFQELLEKLLTYYEGTNGKNLLKELSSSTSIGKFLVNIKQSPEINTLCKAKTQ
jgi:F-type H+-transporting ATPase subunit alpha